MIKSHFIISGPCCENCINSKEYVRNKIKCEIKKYQILDKCFYCKNHKFKY